MTIPLNWLKEIGAAGFVDIIILSVLIYSILIWMKRTQRAAAVLTGILIVAVVYLTAKQFNLFLTAAVFQGFFAIIVVALVVIFQEELRYFFERVAHWSRGPLANRKIPSGKPQIVELLAHTLGDLAREKIGALVVIRGKDLLVRHLEGGQELEGRLSEGILKSIFDPHSAGHDGAVIVEGDIIKSFGCHLPLSKNHEKLRSFGTRHSAALGLAELTDALCLVVSEERGIISVARHGNISKVKDLSELSEIIESFYSGISPKKKTKAWSGFIRKNSREKVLAVGLAVALWIVLVHESRIIFKTYTIEVEHAALPANLTLAVLEPREINITLSGPRRAFYFINPSEIRLFLRPRAFEEGKKAIEISSSDLSIPTGLELETLEPRRILAVVKQRRKPKNNPR